MRATPFEVKVSKVAEQALLALPPLVRIRARLSLSELAGAAASVVGTGPWERLFQPAGLEVDVGGVVLSCAGSRRARRVTLRQVEAGARLLFRGAAAGLPLWRSRLGST